jgi:FlaA1/EpsC-like NDP-sugar epimerase
MDRLKDAMDLMRSGKHVGKIALLNQGAETVVQAQLPASQAIRPDATYLVTGGAGGFGSRIVDKIVTLGATRVVVTVSSNPRCGSNQTLEFQQSRM